MEDFYHNEIKEHSKQTLPDKQQWKKLKESHVQALMSKFAPRENDYACHIMALNIESIRAITAITTGLGFSEAEIPHEMIHIAINTLTSDAITPEEEAMGHFIRKKLRKLSTWKEWEQGEHKQLDQFHLQEMFGSPIDPDMLPKDAVILRAHWQYAIKRSGVRRSRLCCNGSKNAAPQLHAVASTWSSCVELPTQRLFLALAAANGLSIFGADITDAYAHSNPAETATYLAIDDAYSKWYQKRFSVVLNCCHVLPVQHSLQGHPESRTMWIKLID